MRVLFVSKREREREEEEQDGRTEGKKDEEKETAPPYLSALDARRRCCLPCLPGAVLMDARVGPASVSLFCGVAWSKGG